MAPNSPFGREGDKAARGDEPAEPNEGVRLLGAEEVAKVAERAETAKRRGPDEKKYGDRPEAPPANMKPAMRFPLADSADPNEVQRLKPAPVTPPTADDPTGSRPVISVGPPTGETQLPHWTEPATGEVPRVLIGDDADEGDEDKWSAFTAAPRWRDEHTDYRGDDHVGFDDFMEDDEAPLGALDETERQMDEDYLTFDDLEVPDAAAPKAPPRGTASDPIKIQRSGRTPPPPGGAVPISGARTARARAAAQAEREPVAAASPSGGRDRQQAIQVGVGLAVGALVIFLIGAKVAQWFPLILIAGAIVACCAELFNATERAGFRPIRLLGLIMAGAMPLAAYFGGSDVRPAGESGMMLVLFLTLFASMAWYLFGAGKGRPVANIAITLAGVFYVGGLGAYGALLLRAGAWANVAPEPGDVVTQGVAYFLLVAFGTTVCDIGGYLLGSKIGKTPLSAASPNKTREGLAAGMAGCVLVVLLLGGVGHLGVSSMLQALVLGVVIAVVAPLGDLFESMIKRDLGVKDMGDVIPAHGGVLDRLDAYLFTLPAAYYTLKVLGLIA